MELVFSQRLATLGHPQRLALFRLLIRRYPDRVPATELANALGLRPNTLSSYVNALMRVGLVTQERVGTSLRYAVEMAASRETFDYLLQDCCRGRPELCMTPEKSARPADQKFNVLFLCTGNSARSIFAEAIMRKAAGDRFNAFSAGTKPKSGVNPNALTVLQQHGHDVSDLQSKSVSNFQRPDAPAFDFVFTVCNQAANEECPAWLGQPVSAHWGMPDPAQTVGTPAETYLAFQRTYDALQNRITTFTSLPIPTLDRLALQQAVDDIARTPEGALA